MEQVRIGKISSVNKATGKVRVMYADKDEEVTGELPVLAAGGALMLPNIGDMVAVLHLPNGSSSGIVIGTFYNKTITPDGMPVAADANSYRIKTKNCDIEGDSVNLRSARGNISVDDLIRMKEKLDSL